MARLDLNLKEIEAQLRAKLEELRPVVLSSRDGLRVPNDQYDPKDRRAAESDMGLSAGVLKYHQDLLTKVQAALYRITDGSFGICIGCGENIKTSRIQAVPWTPLCVVCQEDNKEEQTLCKVRLQARMMKVQSNRMAAAKPLS